MSEPALWKVSDVAQYLGLPQSSIYKMTAPKSSLRIPHVRIAGRVRFRKEDIDRWLELLAISSNELLAKINHQIQRKALHHGVYI
jgi:excisionase family DNA binding protein